MLDSLKFKGLLGRVEMESGCCLAGGKMAFAVIAVIYMARPAASVSATWRKPHQQEVSDE